MWKQTLNPIWLHPSGKHLCNMNAVYFVCLSDTFNKKLSQGPKQSQRFITASQHMCMDVYNTL